MKWVKHWLDHAHLISDCSPCTRAKVGCVIVDEFKNPVSMGFNGPPRDAPGHLCNVDECERTKLKIKSGTHIEIGCHHAESNALMNALRKGISVLNCKIYITTSPCLVCARLIHHSGIKEVYYPKSCMYDKRGTEYLKSNKIKVIVYN